MRRILEGEEGGIALWVGDVVFEVAAEEKVEVGIEDVGVDTPGVRVEVRP